MKTCSIEGCERKYLAKDMCGKHYQRNLKYGDPLANGQALRLPSRFWAKVDKTSSCWNWTASVNSNGYGQFNSRGRGGSPEAAHRVAYRLTHGSIPEGMHLDHICHNTVCVNPDHLRPVTQKQNLEHLISAHRDSTTGVRGVCRKPNGRFKVSAASYGKTYYGGTFDKLEDAAQAAVDLRNQIFTHNDADRVATK